WSPLVIGVAAFVSSSRPLALLLKGSRPDAILLHDQLVISVIFLCAVCAHFSGFVTGHAARLIALPQNHVVPRLRGPAVGVAVGLTFLGIFLPTLFWPRPLLLPDH